MLVLHSNKIFTKDKISIIGCLFILFVLWYLLPQNIPLLPSIVVVSYCLLGLLLLCYYSINNFKILILILLIVSITLPLLSHLGTNNIDIVIKALKLSVLLLGTSVLFIKYILSSAPIRMSKPFKRYVVLFILALGYFIVRACYDLGKDANVSALFSMFQVFSFPYMLLTIVFYFETKNISWVQKFCWTLLISGVLVALFGIVQWLVGPDVLSSLGFSAARSSFIYDNSMLSHWGSNAELNLFRAFSSLPSGAEFSTYMIITILASLYLYQVGALRALMFYTAVGIMGFGLLATQYMTSLICLVISIILGLILQQRMSVESKQYVISKKKIYSSLLIGSIVLLAMVSSNPKFLMRVMNSFTLSQFDQAGMQTSLFSRLLFLVENIQAIMSYPLGLGLGGDTRGFVFSSDNYMLYLTAMGGLPMMAIYVWLYLLPPRAGWRQAQIIALTGNRELCIFYSLLWGWISTGLLVGPLSNSQITQGSPSNLLFWCGVGMLFKLPVITKQKENLRENNCEYSANK